MQQKFEEQWPRPEALPRLEASEAVRCLRTRVEDFLLAAQAEISLAPLLLPPAAATLAASASGGAGGGVSGGAGGGGVTSLGSSTVPSLNIGTAAAPTAATAPALAAATSTTAAVTTAAKAAVEPPTETSNVGHRLRSMPLFGDAFGGLSDVDKGLDSALGGATFAAFDRGAGEADGFTFLVGDQEVTVTSPAGPRLLYSASSVRAGEPRRLAWRLRIENSGSNDSHGFGFIPGAALEGTQ